MTTPGEAYDRGRDAYAGMARGAAIGASLGAFVGGWGAAVGAAIGTVVAGIVELWDVFGDMFGGTDRHFAQVADRWGRRMMPIGWSPDRRYQWEKLGPAGDVLFRARRAQEDGVRRSLVFAFIAAELGDQNPRARAKLRAIVDRQIEREQQAATMDGFSLAAARKANPALALLEQRAPKQLRPQVRALMANAWLRRHGVGATDARDIVRARFGVVPGGAAAAAAWAGREAAAKRRYLGLDEGPEGPRRVAMTDAARVLRPPTPPPKMLPAAPQYSTHPEPRPMTPSPPKLVPLGARRWRMQLGPVEIRIALLGDRYVGVAIWDTGAGFVRVGASVDASVVRGLLARAGLVSGELGSSAILAGATRQVVAKLGMKLRQLGWGRGRYGLQLPARGGARGPIRQQQIATARRVIRGGARGRALAR